MAYDPDPMAGFCSDGKTNAVTLSEQNLGPAITSCPRAFGLPMNRQGVFQYRPLFPETQIDGRPAPRYERMDEYQPTGGHMFHEIMHLVWGGDQTRIRLPLTGETVEIYNQDQIVNLPAMFAGMNPESYLYAALAFGLAERYEGYQFYTGNRIKS